jgi:adenine phosphoribosyltransferase
VTVPGRAPADPGAPAGSGPAADRRTAAGPAGSAGPTADRTAGDDLAERVAARIRDVPDFPLPGVQFKDLTPLLADGPLLADVAHAIAERHRGAGFDVVAGVEARGFLIAAAVAVASGVGVVPVRKAGKLPWRTVAASYELEYGAATIEVHADAFAEHRRALLVDDVLATGGTLAAAADLVSLAGGELLGGSVVVELTALGGRSRVAGLDLHAVLTV